jgi:hypothetical protein
LASKAIIAIAILASTAGVAHAADRADEAIATRARWTFAVGMGGGAESIGGAGWGGGAVSFGLRWKLGKSSKLEAVGDVTLARISGEAMDAQSAAPHATEERWSLGARYALKRWYFDYSASAQMNVGAGVSRDDAQYDAGGLFARNEWYAHVGLDLFGFTKDSHSKARFPGFTFDMRIYVADETVRSSKDVGFLFTGGFTWGL